ncbi:MAG TPA: acyl-CoA dehydrogenase family protein [Candidatus Thermoplasmatota archaeon]|nr:acyl-CoA dehydrogenase family protein [Candidatus Thermoplasmatota archaeon]
MTHDASDAAELALLRQSVRELAERDLAASAHAVGRGAWPAHGLAACGGMGLLGLAAPTDEGGSGLGESGLAVGIEEIARACGSTGAVVLSHNLAVHALAVAAPGEPLEDLARGRVIATLAIGDAAPVRAEEGVRGVVAATRSDIVLAPAADGLRNYDAATLERVATPLHGLSGAAVGTVELAGAPGTSAGTFPARWAAIGWAALSLGIAQAAVDAAHAFAAERRQFGRSIATFEAVAFKLAEMRASVRAARLLLHDAAAEPDPARAHEARFVCAQTAVDVAATALKIHGGSGFLTDFPVERHLRDARTAAVLGGSVDHHKRMASAGALR